MKKLPGYEDVPLLRDLARNEDERRIFDFVSQAVAISRPVVTTPNVPAARVTALRRAFDAALADPGFLAEARRLELEIAPMSGEQVQALVETMLDTPPDVLAKIAKAVQVKSSEAAAEPQSGPRN